MQVRIEGRDLPGRHCAPGPNFPGYRNVHVAVQRRGRPEELLGLQAADADSVVWSFEATVKPGPDLVGPYLQGGPGNRFIYLSWGSVDAAGRFAMFRRAKLMIAAIDPQVLTAAAQSGVLVARLGLADAKGQPLCAAVTPPRVEWSSASD